MAYKAPKKQISAETSKLFAELSPAFMAASKDEVQNFAIQLMFNIERMGGHLSKDADGQIVKYIPSEYGPKISNALLDDPDFLKNYFERRAVKAPPVSNENITEERRVKLLNTFIEIKASGAVRLYFPALAPASTPQ